MGGGTIVTAMALRGAGFNCSRDCRRAHEPAGRTEWAAVEAGGAEWGRVAVQGAGWGGGTWGIPPDRVSVHVGV